jgi:tRNA A-37 threonylcarbamoyl transferase component Bud32
MLIPLVARVQGEACIMHDDFAAWSGAIRRLRAACLRDSHVDLRQLAGFLDEVPEEQRAEALLDLAHEHIAASWRSGQGQRVESYLSLLSEQDPQWGTVEQVPADLVESEFLARHGAPHGDALGLDEYRSRFAGREDIAALLTKRFVAGGRFVLRRRAGIGATGDVWEAYDRRERSIVALKIPRLDAVNRAHTFTSLAREAQITAALAHPGIVTLAEHRTDGEEPVYAMRFVVGRSFNAAIRDYHNSSQDGGPNERSAALRLLLGGLASACDAIQYAHDHNVVHGDLTPANIILAPAGEAAVLDWGSARLREAPQTIGLQNAVGTPEYMAPEQLGGRVDTRTDVFGLGAVLYETLTGAAPYSNNRDQHPEDWQHQVQEARYMRPRHRNSTAPRPLEAICLKAMERAPESRYVTAADMADAIRDYLRLSAEPGFAAAVRNAWRRLLGRN